MREELLRVAQMVELGDVLSPQQIAAKLRALAAQCGEPLREMLIQAAALAVGSERKGMYQGASWVADAILEGQHGNAAPPSQPVPVAATLDDAAADPALTMEAARKLLRDAAAGIRALYAKAPQPVALPDGLVAVPHGVIDALRFMCETWAGVDEWAYAHADGDALTKYPVIQGTGNQMRLRRIARQRYDHTAIPDALKWVESIAAAPAGEGVGSA